MTSWTPHADVIDSDGPPVSPVLQKGHVIGSRVRDKMAAPDVDVTVREDDVALLRRPMHIRRTLHVRIAQAQITVPVDKDGASQDACGVVHEMAVANSERASLKQIERRIQRFKDSKNFIVRLKNILKTEMFL